MSTIQRKRVCRVPLRGTDPLVLRALRERIKKGSGGRTYVYREHPSASEIIVANHDVEGRRDLLAVYNRGVTVAMLRQDLYHEDPDDIRFADWGGGRAA